MLADLTQTALGLLLGPVLFVLPGFALVQATGVLGVRERALPVQVAAALALSVAVGPILLYAALHAGWAAAWGIYGILGLGGVVGLARGRAEAGLLVRPALAGLALLVVVALLVIDIGTGDRLYFSVVVRDYVKHFALTHEIRLHGVPPSNPFFFDGEALPLFYYYGWLLMTGALDALGGAALGPRGAVFAGTAYGALALAAVTALYAATRPNPLTGSDADCDCRRPGLAAALLAVGGLDVLVFLAGALGLIALGREVVFTDIEWWNEPLFLWVTSILTVPHHTAGLVAALTAFRLLRWGADTPDRRRWAAFVLAALALASSALCSVWVALGAAMAGAVWVGWRTWKRDGAEVFAWGVTGVIAAVVVLPYALDLRAAGADDAGSPIGLIVRPVGPLEWLVGVPRTGWKALLHLPFLPFAYALELGFFALAGGLFWRVRRRLGRPLSRDEGFDRVLLLVGLVVPLFVAAAIRQNDLGFRVPMLAQFVLLLWSADVLDARRRGVLPAPWLRRVLAVLLVVGVASTVTNALVLRFVPPAADAGLLTMPGMYAPDRHLGERTADLRAAYAWLRERTPEGAFVQHHPRPGQPRTEGGFAFPPGSYARRPFVAYDDDYGTLFAVPFERYLPIAHDVASAFEDPAAANAAAVARRHDLAAYVVTDLDPVWNDRASWVWTHEADFARPRVRVFLDPAQRLQP